MGTLNASINLPFTPEDTDEFISYDAKSVESSALFRMLPANAKEYVKKAPHLLEYLHIFPVNTFGIPLFFSELTRDVKGMANPNLIYPVNDMTFIHIFPDENDVRNFYIPIEPSFLHSVTDMMTHVEKKLVDFIDSFEEDPITDEERIEVLRRVLREITYVVNDQDEAKALVAGVNAEKGMKDKILDFLNTDFTEKKKTKKAKLVEVPTTPDGKIILTQMEFNSIEYLLIRDKIQMGILEPFLNDSYIEDITCDGVG
ncbi:MAG: secretion system protein E, partial [Methanomicrobiales archaeon]|nr:secretion system protein E [Methanomicrobiales archaeon]